MIEPIGYDPDYKPEPPPDLVPGPITPQMAPAGPPEKLWLRASHSSAFQCEEFPTEQAAYGSIGGMGMVRFHPGTLPIAQSEQPFNLKNGFIPPGRLPEELDLKDLHPSMQFAPRATVGYLCGDEAIELSGFYQHPQDNTRVATDAGALLVPYFTPSGAFPLGFQGDNGLWNHADLAQVSYQTSVGSAELNYRKWDIAVTGMELILGVRYFYTRENLSQFTNDNAFAVNAFGASNPALAATYSVITQNNILGPQIGAEYSFPCTIPCMGWIWFTGMAKAMAGPNWIQRQWRLTRGDGLAGFNVTKNDVKFSQVYEVNASVDFHILERLRLRVGYMALWSSRVSEPAEQFDYNLADQGSRRTDSSTAFWHGPIAELQFLW